MKKSFKKSIAVLLSVLMAICVMPFSAFAVDDVKPNIALQFNTFSYATTGKTFQNYATPRTMNEAFWKTFGLYAAPLDYKNGALTLKADKANATSTAKGFGATTATSDYTYKTGDYFTVTVRLDNVSKIAATEVAIKYSNNIVPAGIGQTNNAYRFYSLSDTNTASSGANAERARAGYPIPAQSASSLYAGLNDGLIGDASYIDADEKVIYTMVSNQDGNNSTSVASVSETGFTNDNGTSGNNYANKAILATYAFKIIGSGDITFELANPTDVDSCYYLAEEEAGVIPSPEKYQTFAETENEGSAGVTFMGISADGSTTTKYTVVFKNADGTVISSTDYDENADVDVPTLPTKASDATNHYTYAWDKTPATTATADAEYTAVETAAAHTFDAGVVTKEPTTTETGIKTYTCSVCKFTKTETIEKVVAHTHAWGEWTLKTAAVYNTSDAVVTRTCADCGEAEDVTVANTRKLRINAINLTLGSNIAINLKINKTTVDSTNFKRVWAVVNKVNSGNGDKVEAVINDFEDIGGSTPRYQYVYAEMNPQNMMDTYEITFYAETTDGIVVPGPQYNYGSIADYAKNEIGKASNATKTNYRKMLVDMLKYGAQAQIFKSYNADTLATSVLTDAELAIGSSVTVPTYEKTQDTKHVEISNPTRAWKATGLVLDSAVRIRLRIGAATGVAAMTEADLANIAVKVQIDGGSEYLITYEEYPECFAPYPSNASQFYFYFNELAVSQIRNHVYYTICDKDGNALSNTLEYTAETYVMGQSGGMKTLLDAMMVYADSCADYVAYPNA